MKRFKEKLLAGLCIVGLAGCESAPSLRQEESVDSQDKAANVYVSAYPAIPWSDIKEKLEPKHNLTTEQARAMAATVTQMEMSQFLSTFVAGLGLGFPTNTNTTTTQIDASGNRTSTGTQTRSAGSVPASSPATFTPIPADALAANLTAGPMAVGLDASTLLTVGTAVFQQAQILDAQISKGIEPKGYKAYLVTFQINLQPKRRNLPYDTYINISLFPGSWKDSLATSDSVGAIDGLPPVMVYPLIITDAMEAASVGRSIEVMRSVALQLSGMVKAVGANATLGGGTDRVEALVGMDKNSLITLGRVSDHTLRIRLGAQNTGRGSTMLPRTHNVSVVIFARWDAKEKDKRLKALYAVTESALESTDGHVLPSGQSRSRGRLAAEVAHSVMRYGYEVKADCTPVERAAYQAPPWIRHRLPERFKDEQPRHEFEPAPDRYLELLQAVDRADYGHVKKCLGIRDEHNTQADLTLRRLLAELIEIQSGSRYSKMVIALRDYDDPTHPVKEQLALYSDDGKAFTSIALRGGKGLTPQIIEAQLKLKSGAVLLPDQVAVKDGSHVDLRFPSFTQLEVKPTDFEAKPLTLSLPGNPVPAAEKYELRSIKLEVKPVSNPVSSPHSILVADPAGTARVTLLVSKLPEGVKAPMRLTVSGGDVRPDAALGASALTNKGVMIEAEKTVTLFLGNLSPTRPVTITTMDAADKPIGDPITLTVDRLPARVLP